MPDQMSVPQAKPGISLTPPEAWLLFLAGVTLGGAIAVASFTFRLEDGYPQVSPIAIALSSACFILVKLLRMSA